MRRTVQAALLDASREIVALGLKPEDIVCVRVTRDGRIELQTTPGCFMYLAEGLDLRRSDVSRVKGDTGSLHLGFDDLGIDFCAYVDLLEVPDIEARFELLRPETGVARLPDEVSLPVPC